MLIRRMTATFGKLREQTLELREGLNILQAPNETGKSTWCAFLLAMLYGVNTKERDRAGVLADKNRYAPWNGGSMSGRLDCRAGEDALTLFRTTRRPAAPMGDFQALYTGTADPVPGLTGASCGESLLGVSREVYARSAFIRQGGMAVTQDSGLERRIAALVTSGEEDTSYTEAVEALKKQLNRRRHNKTGQLPALEAELQETEAQLASQAELARQRENLLARSAELEARESSLKEELAGLDRWAEHRKRQDLQKVEDAAVQAEEKAAAFRRRLEEEQVPENDVTVRLRGAIVNLNTVRKSAEKAQEAYDAAKSALAQAEENLVRLRDIMGELENRVGPLKTQSEKAQQFLILSEEKKTLELSLWLERLEKLRQELRSQEDKVLLCKNDRAAAQTRLEQLEEELPDLCRRIDLTGLLTEEDREELLALSRRFLTSWQAAGKRGG